MDRGRRGAQTYVCDPRTEIGSGTWSAIAAGSHGCGINTASQTWCWGLDWFGETGPSGIGPFQAMLTQVGTGSDWSSVAVGMEHSCGMTSAGPVCWGNNSFGQLGTNSKDGQTHATPAPLSGSPPLISLTAGENHSCGLTSDGTAYCWGDGFKGQLGNGATSSVSVATAISGMTWKKLAAGGYSTCGIASDGSLYCWGDNSRGQLGDGTLDQHAVPTRVGTDTDWVDLSVGYSHACATKADHSLWCWGANDDGQLADGTGWRDQWVQVP